MRGLDPRIHPSSQESFEEMDGRVKPGSVNFGIKHVQGLPISYTNSSTNLHDKYENYSWKVTKDGETAGIEDPKKKNHLMSAGRYGLTMLAGARPTTRTRRSGR
jgi:hypothetical protein